MKQLSYAIFGFVFLTVISQNNYAQEYKSMMNDYQYNFYDVVEKAESYFETHAKGKGSGYKGYQRWKYENEGKFFPSGDRSQVNPYFVQNAWLDIKSKSLHQVSRSAQNEWVDLGPYDANNVTSHYSEGIGRVETFYVDRSDTNTMYLGSRSGGFWRTFDGGQSWECTTDTLVATGVNSLAASTTNSDSVVISLRNANNGYSQGAYISTDAGKTWKESSFNPSNLGWGGLGRTGRINEIVVSPFDSKVILIASDRGLFKSSDFLNSYSLIRSGNFTQVEFHPSMPNIYYAYDRNSANRNYILVSTNAGLSFSQSAILAGNSNSTNVRIKTSRACPTCLYVASSNGIWKSTDQGANYQYYSKPTTNNSGPQGFAIAERDTSNMIYGYVDLDASIDGGQNFRQRTWWSTGNGNHTGSSYIHADLRYAESVLGSFYVGTDGYLCRSTDGGISWEILSDGTGIREYYRFGLSQSRARLSMAGSQDNGTTIHTGNSTIEWNGGDGMEAVVQSLNENWMVGSWQYGNRNRTKDGGQTRHNVAHANGNDWIAPMVVDPNHQMRIYSFGKIIFRSETFGRNWDPLATPNYGNIRHAAIAENNSNIMLLVRNNMLHISYDGGLSLDTLTDDLPNTRSISAIAFDPNDDSTVVITYDSYQDDNRRIYISRDLCKTWENISFNLSNMPLRTVVIDHTDSSNIYVGGEIGVYYKSKNANNWSVYSKGLPNVSVRELDIQRATNTLRAVTWGRGMWETKLVGRESFPEIVNVEVSERPTDDQPVEDLPIYVTVEANVPGTRKDVTIMWSKDSAKLDNAIYLRHVNGNEYVTDTPIPNFMKGTDVYFKVFATSDSKNTTESYKFHYQYKECTSRPNNVVASASKTSIVLGDSVTLTGSGALTYEWDQGVEDGVAFAPTVTKSYKLTGRDINKCAGYDSVTVEVEIPSGINNTVFGDGFKVFPNPTSGQVQVDLSSIHSDVSLEVYSVDGKLILQQSYDELKEATLDLSSYSNGQYLLQINSPAGSKTIKLLKEK